MTRNPAMRASDTERDRAAAALREHCAQGRLTMEEFHERLEVVYEAKTVGDLDRLTWDLPAEDLYELPVPVGTQSLIQPRSREAVELALPGGLWPWLWGVWAAVSALNFTVWLLLAILPTVELYPWWIWVAGPWGVAQLAAHVADRRHDRSS